MRRKNDFVYKLIPLFLRIPEEHNFADMWEVFCCNLLNLNQGTDHIIRRGHPDFGIDLYDQDKEIAYQCKSVESGKSADFNVSKVISSVNTAKKEKERNLVNWKKYIVCTNVKLSGPQESKLKKVLPDIKIYPESYWLGLCEKYSDHVNRYFRRLESNKSEELINQVSEISVDISKPQREQLIDKKIKELNDSIDHYFSLVSHLEDVQGIRSNIEQLREVLRNRYGNGHPNISIYSSLRLEDRFFDLSCKILDFLLEPRLINDPELRTSIFDVCYLIAWMARGWYSKVKIKQRDKSRKDSSTTTPDKNFNRENELCEKFIEIVKGKLYQNFIGNLIKIRNKNTVDQEIVRDATIIFEDLLNKIQNSPVEYV